MGCCSSDEDVPASEVPQGMTVGTKLFYKANACHVVITRVYNKDDTMLWDAKSVDHANAPEIKGLTQGTLAPAKA